MTAKKIVVKKEKPIPKPVYKPVFLPIVIKTVKKHDANYYGIKQKLKNNIGLDLFKKLRNGKPKKEQPEKKKQDYYNEMNELILLYWVRYCNWFNKVVNHE
jgi:hypothetical protein